MFDCVSVGAFNPFGMRIALKIFLGKQKLHLVPKKTKLFKDRAKHRRRCYLGSTNFDSCMGHGLILSHQRKESQMYDSDIGQTMIHVFNMMVFQKSSNSKSELGHCILLDKISLLMVCCFCFSMTFNISRKNGMVQHGNR